MNRWIYEWIDKCMWEDGSTIGWMDGWMDAVLGACVNERTDKRRVNGQIVNGWLSACADK